MQEWHLDETKHDLARRSRLDDCRFNGDFRISESDDPFPEIVERILELHKAVLNQSLIFCVEELDYNEIPLMYVDGYFSSETAEEFTKIIREYDRMFDTYILDVSGIKLSHKDQHLLLKTLKKCCCMLGDYYDGVVIILPTSISQNKRDESKIECASNRHDAAIKIRDWFQVRGE